MYYPKSQIKTNLYTNGEDFFLTSTGERYTGFYHMISSNQFFTGKTPNTPPIRRLTPNPQPTAENVDGSFLKNEIVVQSKSYESYSLPEITGINLEYATISNTSKNRLLPPPSSPIPNTASYQLGEFERYFCKKNNELFYFEINQQTSDLLSSQTPTIAFDLYTSIQLPWSLTGDIEKVYNTNKNIVSLIEKKFKWYGFSSIFKENYTKYYLAS